MYYCVKETKNTKDINPQTVVANNGCLMRMPLMGLQKLSSQKEVEIFTKSHYHFYTKKA